MIVPSFEAHTSNDLKNQEDSLSAKLSLQVVFNPVYYDPTWTPAEAEAEAQKFRLFNVQMLSFTPTYQRDRIKSTETYGGDLTYTPILNHVPGMTAVTSLRPWDRPADGVATVKEGRAVGYLRE